MEKNKYLKRLELLDKLKKEFEQTVDSIAKAIALETGKPLWESKTESSALVGKIDARSITH